MIPDRFVALSDGGFIEKRMSYRKFRRVSPQLEAEAVDIMGLMPRLTYTQADVDACAEAFALDEATVATLTAGAGVRAEPTDAERAA